MHKSRKGHLKSSTAIKRKRTTFNTTGQDEWPRFTWMKRFRMNYKINYTEGNLKLYCPMMVGLNKSVTVVAEKK